MIAAEHESASLVVDMHVHVFDHGYLPGIMHDATARSWAARTWPMRDPAEVRDRLEPNMADPSAEFMLADLDEAGVDVGVMLALDAGFGFGEEPARSAAQIMEHYSQLQASTGGRLLGFAGVDPRRPNAIELCEQALGELGLRGVKLYPPHGYYMSEPEPLRICGIANERDVPVIVHTAVVGTPALSWFSDPLHLAMVQRTYPDLTILIGHAGFDVWAQHAARVAAGHDRTFLEVSQWDSLARSNPESFIRVLANWRDLIGAHRIVFGSDHISGPHLSKGRTHLSDWVGFFRALPERAAAYGISFTQEEVDLILGGNAARILRLDVPAQAARR